MVEKIKADVDRLLLLSKMMKSLILAKSTEIFVFIIKTKNNLSTYYFSQVSHALKWVFLNLKTVNSYFIAPCDVFKFLKG